jgi:hypothetical protein
MKRKFKLEWINVPGIEFDYNEVWDHDDIRHDFSDDKEVMSFAKKSKKGNAYIVFDYKGKGFLMITRVSNSSRITI